LLGQSALPGRPWVQRAGRKSCVRRSDEPGPPGVEVERAHQVPAVGVVLHHDGRVAVREEMAAAPMAAAVGASSAGAATTMIWEACALRR
jgi:hypothetical protein